ncbi:MAG: acetyl-CoA carboxylase biotin carboxyl carrier protein [Nitratireductor sp.]|nr:acetyl-CoA carboxylase biotin carboxyl carrier protein [Nitratireductor sp.]
MSKKTTIDQEMIRELAELLKETELSEIEIEQDDLRIRIARHSARSYEVAAPMVAAPAVAAALATPVAAPEPVSDAKHPGAVTAPMVGTVYLSPAPGADPFVKVGDAVKAGQTVMIVEAMKTMNQIAAPKAGTVARILVEDSQPVEYGEPLLIIE